MNKAKDGPGKRLGAKKSGGEFNLFVSVGYKILISEQNNM